MPKAYLLSLVLVFDLCISLVAAQTNTVTIEQLAGGYLRKEYVETLKATKDPQEAFSKVSDECGLNISKPTAFLKVTDKHGLSTYKRDDDYLLGHYARSFNYNFHEGGGSPAILEIKPVGDDSFLLVFGEEAPTKDPNNPVKLIPSISDEFIRIVSRAGNDIQEIEWSKRIFTDANKIGWKKATFVRVDGANYVNKTVLAGKYKDQQGRPFVFTEEKAIWPERTFNYNVNQDFTMGDYDCNSFDILDDNHHRTEDKPGAPAAIGFQWKDGKLYIFNLIPPPPDDNTYKCGKEPVYILTPVQPR